MNNKSVGGMGRIWVGFFALAFVLGLMAVPASAQQAGTILGVVKDASGGFVPDAKITITNTDTNDSRATVTGDDGSYRAPGLQPGHYSVKVEKEGFKTVTQTSLTLDVAAELVVNPTLEVGTATQEVTVTGEAPIVNTTTSSLGGLVNDQQISELPLNGRNYTDLTLLQAGIAQTTHSGLGDAGLWYSSNGMSPRSNNYTLDGALTVTQNGTGPASMNGSTLGVDGIKEYKIVTSMFGAEYGLLMGSQMVIVSKSGTNQFHGDVFEYLRNNHLDARNFFEAPTSIIAGPYNRLPQFQRNNFGGSVGGPIIKDKTFFFLVYEGLRLSQGDTIQDTTLAAACHFVQPVDGTGTAVGSPIIIGGGPIPSNVTPPTGAVQKILQGPISTVVPGATGAVLADLYGMPATTVSKCGGVTVPSSGIVPQVASLVQPWIGQFPFPNETGFSSFNYSFPAQTRSRDDYAQLRIDHNFSTNDNLFGRYTLEDAVIFTPYLGGNLSATDTGTGYPQVPAEGRSRNQYVTLGENHIFSPTVLNSFRLSFARTNYINLVVTPNTPLNPNFALQDAGTGCASSSSGCIWSFVPGNLTGGFSPGSGVTALTPPGTFPNYHIQNVWTFDDDLFWTKGKHAFKFGTMVNLFQEPQLQSKAIFGTVNFANNASFIAGVPSNFNVVLPGQSVALNPGVPGATLLAPPYQGNFLDRNVLFKTYGFYAQDDWRATERVTLNLGVRYEFRSNFSEEYGRESCIPNLLNSTAALTTCGVMSNPSYKNWSPRIGVAWDVFGNGKTAIRSGVGIYYDLGNYGALLTQGPTGMPPFVANTTYQNGSNLPMTQACTSAQNQVSCLQIPLNGGSAAAGKSLQGNDYNAKSVHALEANLTLSQQLPFGFGVDISYVVARGLGLYQSVEGNPVVPSSIVNGIPTYNVPNGVAGCQNNALTVGQQLIVGGTVINPGDPKYPCRVNPYFTSALWFTNAGQSWYNGLQISVTKHLGHGLSVQGAYTYSKSEDDTQGMRFNDDCGGNAAAPFSPYPYNTKLDWSLSCYDITQVMHMNLIYHLPGIKSNGFVSKFTNGWWMSSVVAVQGGPPFTPIINTDRAFDGVISQSNIMRASLNTTATNLTVSCSGTAPIFYKGPSCSGGTATINFIPYNPATVITGDPNQWYNPLMFGEAALGQVGNAPRNMLRQPGLGNWDFSIVKDTRLGFLGEGGNLQFRAEFFNIMNRANFLMLGTSTTAAGAFAGNTSTNCTGGAVSCDFQAPLGTAGAITNTSTTARQIQLALKLYF